jgi:hypothetical protein
LFKIKDEVKDKDDNNLFKIKDEGKDKDDNNSFIIKDEGKDENNDFLLTSNLVIGASDYSFVENEPNVVSFKKKKKKRRNKPKENFIVINDGDDSDLKNDSLF